MTEYALTLDPSEKIVFSSKALGEESVSTSLNVTNPLAERVAVKVKCTSNELFRIRPPVFCLNANEKTIVSLSFNGGKQIPENGKHYFAVYYIKPTGEYLLPRKTWAEHIGEPLGTKRIYVDFKKESDEVKKGNNDDKEEPKEELRREVEEQNKEEKEEEKKEEKKEDMKKEENEERNEDNKEDKEEERINEKEDKKGDKDDQDDSKKEKKSE